jgi:hypothetical protein
VTEAAEGTALLEREIACYEELTDAAWRMNDALRRADTAEVRRCLALQEGLMWEVGRLRERGAALPEPPDMEQARRQALARLAAVCGQNAVLLREGISVLRHTLLALAEAGPPGPWLDADA